MSKPLQNFYEFGPFRLDAATRLLTLDGASVPLTPKAGELLFVLVQNSGQVVDKEELINTLWPDTIVEENNLTVTMSALRKALGESVEQKYIETFPKRGYRFVTPVRKLEDEGADLIVQEHTRSQVVIEDEEEKIEDRGSKDSKRAVLYPLFSILGLLLLVGLAVAFYFWSKEAPTSWSNATHLRLTDQPGMEVFPSLSPDGKSFVYASQASGNWDIYLQRVGGTNPINLTKDSAAVNTEPAFSPDGEQIAFRSKRDGDGIFVMGATGESVKRLTDFGHHPAWSPDGKEILCTIDSIMIDPASRPPVPSQLWSVNVATGEKRPVTKGHAVQPQWSPHGQRIAYWAYQDGKRNIWTIPASGGEPAPVTNDEVDWNPVWSPDGSYLYYVSDRSGSMNLWRVPMEEASGQVLGPPEPITTPSAHSTHLSFSRDGRHMAYVQMTWTINIQNVGFDPEKETVIGQPVLITEGSRKAGGPDLSPDGEWVVFHSRGEKQTNLFIIKRDGTGQRQLTEGIYEDRSPRWSPDGRRIAFESNRSVRREIWLINTDGSGLQQLTYTSGSDVRGTVWSPDGRRLAYSTLDGKAFIMDVGKAWQEQTLQALPQALLGFYPHSWSSDGRKLAGFQHRAGIVNGIVVYSFESQQYEQLTDFGGSPIWLSDNRRLLFESSQERKLYLVDSRSKKVHEVLSVAPRRSVGPKLSRDDRQIYFGLQTTESDIWLMTLPRGK